MPIHELALSSRSRALGAFSLPPSASLLGPLLSYSTDKLSGRQIDQRGCTQSRYSTYSTVRIVNKHRTRARTAVSYRRGDRAFFRKVGAFLSNVHIRYSWYSPRYKNICRSIELYRHPRAHNGYSPLIIMNILGATGDSDTTGRL